MDDTQAISRSPNGGTTGAGLDPRYVSFFGCFNTGRFFEAHEVLEALWLPMRGQPDAPFYQGLIQLAGAFVHLKHDRPAPATRLLRAALAKLDAYPPHHGRLDLETVRRLARRWLEQLESDPGPAPGWIAAAPPQLPVPGPEPR